MNAEALINALLVSDTNSLGLYDVIIAMTLPFMLTFPVSFIYRLTQKNHNYTTQYIHSLFLFSCLTSVITMLIGSNIARAFGLIGALSIIRFRNALKSTIDAIYIFWSLAIGMACGTGFYFASVVLVVMGCIFVLILHFTRYGESIFSDSILKVTIPPDREDELVASVEAMMGQDLRKYRLINTIYNSASDSKTHIYGIRSSAKGNKERELIGRIKQVDGIISVSHISQETPFFA